MIGRLVNGDPFANPPISRSPDQEVYAHERCTRRDDRRREYAGSHPERDQAPAGVDYSSEWHSSGGCGQHLLQHDPRSDRRVSGVGRASAGMARHGLAVRARDGCSRRTVALCARADQLEHGQNPARHRPCLSARRAQSAAGQGRPAAGRSKAGFSSRSIIGRIRNPPGRRSA